MPWQIATNSSPPSRATRSRGRNTRRSRVATSRSAALNVARSYLERVRGRDPWSLNNEPVVRVDGSGELALLTGEFTRELRVTVDRANLLTLEVIVTGPRLPAPIRLMTNM